jgi:hypothetical protein
MEKNTPLAKNRLSSLAEPVLAMPRTAKRIVAMLVDTCLYSDSLAGILFAPGLLGTAD